MTIHAELLLNRCEKTTEMPSDFALVECVGQDHSALESSRKIAEGHHERNQMDVCKRQLRVEVRVDRLKRIPTGSS